MKNLSNLGFCAMKNLSNFGIYNFIYDLHEKFINEKTFLNILKGNPKLFLIVNSAG